MPEDTKQIKAADEPKPAAEPIKNEGGDKK